MSKPVKPGMVRRFSVWARTCHWIYVVSFLILYLTGLPKFTHWSGFDIIYKVFGGPANTMIVHRIFACTLVSTVIIILIFDRKTFFHWMKQLVTWGKRDINFLMAFPKEFFTGHAKYDKQDFYNAGEKVNSILQIICAIMFVASGFVMWFPQFFSNGIINWAYPIHDISVGVATAVVIGHIFLAALHPNVEGMKGGLGGMFHGDVPEKYAREHHGVWYDELMEEKKKSKKKA